MIELFYLRIPSLEDVERHKNSLIEYLPKEEEHLYLEKNFNKSRLSSFLAKIVLYRLAKQRIKSFNITPFSYHKQGKPYFKEYPSFFFNISHSIDYVVVGLSDKDLGVDIERIRNYNKTLAERFLHPEEFQFLESLDKDKQPYYFTSIWNLKECYVKYTGEGIANTFKEFIIDVKDNSSIKIQNGKIPVYFKQYENIPDYLISVCSPHDFPANSITKLTIDSLIN